MVGREGCCGLHCINCAGDLEGQIVRSQVGHALHIAKGLHHVKSYVGMGRGLSKRGVMWGWMGNGVVGRGRKFVG